MASSDERTMSNDSGTSPRTIVEKSRVKKPHFFSRSLSRGNFSWSFVRNALQSANKNALSPLSRSSCSSDESPSNARSSNTNSVSSFNSSISDESSDGCSSFSRSSSASGSSSWRSHLTRSSGISEKRKGSKFTSGERKPALVEKIPFGSSSKYLTVYVGPRIEEAVKYIINRKLLTHPLFQVLLTCSEDEFGEDFSVDKGVAVVCDPALFLQLVRAVDDSMWKAQSAVSEDDLV